MQTVSFLTYLLKSFADYIKQHEESICKSIVNLLVTCSDSVSIRKVGLSCNFMSFSLFTLLKIDLCKLSSPGTIGSSETCAWDGLQTGFISFD